MLNSHINGSYYYNGNVDHQAGTRWGRRGSLTMDDPGTIITTSHFASSHEQPNHKDRFTIMRIDGSALQLRSSTVYALGQSSNHLNWDNIDATMTKMREEIE